MAALGLPCFKEIATEYSLKTKTIVLLVKLAFYSKKTKYLSALQGLEIGKRIDTDKGKGIHNNVRMIY